MGVFLPRAPRRDPCSHGKAWGRVCRPQLALCKKPQAGVAPLALGFAMATAGEHEGRRGEADCKAASYLPLYPKAPLALQGTAHTWLKLETTKEGKTNGGEKRPRWHRQRLQEDRETAGARAKPTVWERGCPGVKVPLGTPPPAFSPACSLVVDSQASYSCSKPTVSAWGSSVEGAATRAMPTLAGPHSPRPPPQAFLFTKNVHCRHLPRAWVTIDWVCFLESSGGKKTF